MKRAAQLIESITRTENLELAFWKAQQGKAGKREVMAFRAHLAQNIRKLHAELSSGEICFGPYRQFLVYEPKKRTISVAPFQDRVVHHALMNVCEPVFERYSIFDSYACRKGKGSHAAVRRAQHFSRRFQWFLKLDIAKYYPNVDHQVLLRSLERVFKDRGVLEIFERLIASFNGPVRPGAGIPIGNLTSQHFANFFLGGLDHWLKEQQRVPGYVRYMDDFVLWADEKSQLRHWLRAIRLFLASNCKLELKDEVLLNRCTRGIPFLGYRVFPDQIQLKRQSRRRFHRKFLSFERKRRDQVWTEEQTLRHMQPLLAFSRFADTRGLRQNELQWCRERMGADPKFY